MRPSLNGNHIINATTINIKNLPVSRKVLYIGDKFRINDVSYRIYYYNIRYYK